MVVCARAHHASAGGKFHLPGGEVLLQLLEFDVSVHVSFALFSRALRAS